MICRLLWLLKHLQSPACAIVQKRGSVTLRHNELCDNISEILQEVTNNVRIEPIVQPLTGRELLIGGNVSVDVWADISGSGF